MTLAHEINAAARELRFDDHIRQLPPPLALEAIRAAEEKFVAEKNLRWWWEALRPEFPCISSRPLSDGYRLLPAICPDTSVWLFASDDEDLPWPVFAARPSTLSSVIGGCRYFEYAVADPDLNWIVFENHHNVLVALGEPVASRLLKHAG